MADPVLLERFNKAFRVNCTPLVFITAAIFRDIQNQNKTQKTNKNTNKNTNRNTKPMKQPTEYLRH